MGLRLAPSFKNGGDTKKQINNGQLSKQENDRSRISTRNKHAKKLLETQPNRKIKKIEQFLLLFEKTIHNSLTTLRFVQKKYQVNTWIHYLLGKSKKNNS